MIYQIPYQITLGIWYIRLGNEPSPVVTDLMDQILQSDGSNNLIIYVCSLNTRTLIKPMENYHNIRIECRDQRKGWKSISNLIFWAENGFPVQSRVAEMYQKPCKSNGKWTFACQLAVSDLFRPPTWNPEMLEKHEEFDIKRDISGHARSGKWLKMIKFLGENWYLYSRDAPKLRETL